MAKFDEVKGFVRGISDDEFEVLLNLSFTLHEFQVEKIRRDSLVSNDFLLGLSRNEKKFLRGEERFNYVAYVDRKRHEFSNEWMLNFWNRVNSDDLPLYSRPDNEIEKIFILSIDKIRKKEIRKDLKNNIKFFDGNGFFDFLFNLSSDRTSLLSSLYSDESKKWDEMSHDKQKNFCENNNVDYIKFERLWKYPIGQQSKMIIALQNSRNTTNDKKEKREQRKEKDKRGDLMKRKKDKRGEHKKNVTDDREVEVHPPIPNQN
jgi:hypothetical protein